MDSLWDLPNLATNPSSFLWTLLSTFPNLSSGFCFLCVNCEYLQTLSGNPVSTLAWEVSGSSSLSFLSSTSVSLVPLCNRPLTGPVLSLLLHLLGTQPNLAASPFISHPHSSMSKANRDILPGNLVVTTTWGKEKVSHLQWPSCPIMLFPPVSSPPLYQTTCRGQSFLSAFII